MYVYDNINKNKSQALRTYKDDRTHSMYRCFVQQRNQAVWRGEEWEMEFEEWKDLWDPHFENRGRKKDNHGMTRIDINAPWAVGNVEVMKRVEILAKNSAMPDRVKNKRNYVRTPAGDFHCKRDAAEHYGLSYYKITKLFETKPDEFYYIKNKK